MAKQSEDAKAGQGLASLLPPPQLVVIQLHSSKSISLCHFTWLGMAGFLRSRAKPRHGKFSHPEAACDVLICENAQPFRGRTEIGCLQHHPVHSVYGQFNVWLMLGWQSSSIFSLISSGLCLGKITRGAEHRDCRVLSLQSFWQKLCSSAAQLAHTAVSCTGTRDSGAKNTNSICSLLSWAEFENCQNMGIKE